MEFRIFLRLVFIFRVVLDFLSDVVEVFGRVGLKRVGGKVKN